MVFPKKIAFLSAVLLLSPSFIASQQNYNGQLQARDSKELDFGRISRNLDRASRTNFALAREIANMDDEDDDGLLAIEPQTNPISQSLNWTDQILEKYRENDMVVVDPSPDDFATEKPTLAGPLPSSGSPTIQERASGWFSAGLDFTQRVAVSAGLDALAKQPVLALGAAAAAALYISYRAGDEVQEDVDDEESGAIAKARRRAVQGYHRLKEKALEIIPERPEEQEATEPATTAWHKTKKAVQTPLFQATAVTAGVVTFLMYANRTGPSEAEKKRYKEAKKNYDYEVSAYKGMQQFYEREKEKLLANLSDWKGKLRLNEAAVVRYNSEKNKTEAVRTASGLVGLVAGLGSLVFDPTGMTAVCVLGAADSAALLGLGAEIHNGDRAANFRARADGIRQNIAAAQKSLKGLVSPVAPAKFALELPGEVLGEVSKKAALVIFSIAWGAAKVAPYVPAIPEIARKVKASPEYVEATGASAATSLGIGWMLSELGRQGVLNLPLTANGFRAFSAGSVPASFLGSFLAEYVTQRMFNRESTLLEKTAGGLVANFLWGCATLWELEGLGGFSLFQWLLLNPNFLIFAGGGLPALFFSVFLSSSIVSIYEGITGNVLGKVAYWGIHTLVWLFVLISWAYVCFISQGENEIQKTQLIQPIKEMIRNQAQELELLPKDAVLMQKKLVQEGQKLSKKKALLLALAFALLLFLGYMRFFRKKADV